MFKYSKPFFKCGFSITNVFVKSAFGKTLTDISVKTLRVPKEPVIILLKS